MCPRRPPRLSSFRGLTVGRGGLLSLSEKLSKRTLPTQDVTLCLDGALTAERDALLSRIAELEKKRQKDAEAGSDRARNPELAKALKAVADIEERMRESQVTLRISGLPFVEYNTIMRAHPPKKGAQSPFNAETFFLAAAKVSAQYVGDDGELEAISDDDWSVLEQSLTDGEHDLLANAVLFVNRTYAQASPAFLGHASKPTRP